MALVRYKSRGVHAASIATTCEACREGPATTLVVDSIFAWDLCAERISTVLWHGGEERALTAGSFSSELGPRQRFH
jgi:hypothetical protein